MARRRARDLNTLRVAIYWAPEPGDPLARAGATWLGRDAELGAPATQPDVPGLAEATASPRRYGFHATLRPPMRLATGWEEIVSAAHQLAASTAAFDMPRLQITELGGFLAIQQATPCPALHALADLCVTATDKHRLRADATELAQRRVAGLTARQDDMLLRWGYPYVLADWRFHMTLSHRLPPAEMARLKPIAEAHFAAALQQPRRVESIAVFTQLGGGDFLLGERFGLLGREGK